MNKTGGLSFGVVGANNGQYIKTTAAGTDVVADLSDDAKAKLNHTVEVAPGSSNVTVTTDTTDPNKTVYKVAVANTPAAGASSTESVVKKLLQLAILTLLMLLLVMVKTLAMQMLNTKLMFPVMLLKMQLVKP